METARRAEASERGRGGSVQVPGQSSRRRPWQWGDRGGGVQTELSLLSTGERTEISPLNKTHVIMQCFAEYFKRCPKNLYKLDITQIFQISWGICSSLPFFNPPPYTASTYFVRHYMFIQFSWMYSVYFCPFLIGVSGPGHNIFTWRQPCGGPRTRGGGAPPPQSEWQRDDSCKPHPPATLLNSSILWLVKTRSCDRGDSPRDHGALTSVLQCCCSLVQWTVEL